MLRRVLGFLLRFFFRSFTKVMGCVIACFRIRDKSNRRINISQSISASTRSTAVLISHNQNRSPSILSEEERDDSAQNGSVGFQDDIQGLKDEAKFLKACRTIPGTPAEIRKASGKLKRSPSSDEDSEPSRFHSWLPNTSVEKLQLDVQPFDPPTPIKICQGWGNNIDSFEHTPSSCISNAQECQDDPVEYMEKSWPRKIHTANRPERNATSVSPMLATNTQRKNKSVRFENDNNDLASYGSSSDDWDVSKTKSPNNQSAYNPSPYPTPLKLFDEMQTPGTVYPASLEDLRNGKAQVRSQFVYPTYNPGENVFPYKIHGEKAFNVEEDSSDLGDSVEQAQNGPPTPVRGLKKDSNGNEAEVKSNSSSRLSPVSNIVENSPISLKWWDGHGIPNTTTKYKEDQKVKWHATPFEERLDKALSEDNCISQRKLVCGKPMAFDEIEESDTASSQL